MPTITHGELFAGISGFGLGCDRAGIKTIWQVEIDRACQSVLKRHYPDALLLSDVKECGGQNLPYVDIISFGSPCQDLSIAGRRKGLINGERSNLFFEAVRIVGELKPSFAVWENVPGALSSNNGRDFAAVLSAFRKCGARDLAWRILDAQYFGVAQRRRRIFLIADFRSERAAQVLFEREGVSGNTPPSRETGQEVAYSIRSNPSHSGDKGDGGINTTLISNTLGSHHYGDNADFTYIPEIADPLTVRMAQHGGASAGNDCYPHNHVVTAYNIQHNDGGEHKRQDRPNGGMYVNETDTALTVGSTDMTAIAETLRLGGKGGIPSPRLPGEVAYDSFGVRRLTPTECERLQGFPDGWTSGQADSTRYKQLGNAVAVPVVEWIMRRIVALSPSPETGA